MASRPFPNFAPGFGRNALDLPVAALAAVAAAFAAFAMPGDLMAGLVEGSGLPNLLSAAAPPLGLKARLGVGLIGAVGAFGIVFVLLRLLDRTGLEPRRPDRGREEEAEDEAPRLRRRDFHPDAPVRRPISAVRDLGEPAPPQPPAASLWPEAPIPAGWQEGPKPAAPPAPEPEGTPLWLDAPAPEPQREPEPILAEQAGLEPAPPPSPLTDDDSLPALMARLEQGLARRARSAPLAAPEPGPEPAPQSAPARFPEAGDDRLQSAIESLQRLAARD